MRAITEVVLHYLSFHSGLLWGRVPQLPLLGCFFVITRDENRIYCNWARIRIPSPKNGGTVEMLLMLARANCWQEPTVAQANQVLTNNMFN
jgi:hypothetical protein